MADLGTSLKTKILTLQTPTMKDQTMTIIFGVLNCFFWGIMVIIAGVMNNDMADVIIGLLQLCLPFVGWAWAIFWGVLMIVKGVNMK
jgi:hypothetical protein